MYLPLEIAKKLDYRTLDSNSALRRVNEILMGNPDKSLEFLCSDCDFMNPGYDGEFKEFSKYVIQNQKILLNAINGSNQPDKKSLSKIAESFCSM